MHKAAFELLKVNEGPSNATALDLVAFAFIHTARRETEYDIVKKRSLIIVLQF